MRRVSCCTKHSDLTNGGIIVDPVAAPSAAAWPCTCTPSVAVANALAGVHAVVCHGAQLSDVPATQGICPDHQVGGDARDRVNLAIQVVHVATCFVSRRSGSGLHACT